ncbi:hypothetical protein [Microbacterium sp. K24]|uniref:hypothetical protein n=1 Tax=Microbacterium sp. K24 TaxID=2305446 RepID=UPI00109CACB3|nr:hypothetical protein [Microbacterium sp. K24]
MTDEVTPATVAAQITPRTLTQAQIDTEVARALRDAKPADYDEVREQAEAASVLERQIADLEQQIMATRRESLRVSIAARFGISDDDRDVLLTGTDEVTLLMQAERLGNSTRALGNVARQEGRHVSSGGSRADREMREYVNDLFGNDVF